LFQDTKLSTECKRRIVPTIWAATAWKSSATPMGGFG
jgi:hypothetical protein